MTSTYLQRYAVQKCYLGLIDCGDPEIIVVIPCHKEEHLIDSLNALEQCKVPNGDVSIITVINASEADEAAIHQLNEKTLVDAQVWAKAEKRKYDYHFILENKLPKKHAGVGLARKIGMDEAVRIFEANSRDGVILCFDADSLCDDNLLVEVERLFADGKTNGCSIHYEHPLAGNLSDEIYEGIISYELHLRYYIGALKYAGFPYAYQTIGSSMAVRSLAYQKQGGMNRRKAGEDFYFLHRIIPLGNFKNLNSTKIIPSPRSSDRVPFGTGKAIGDWLLSERNQWQTYHPEIFEVLKEFIDQVDSFYGCGDLKNAYESLPNAFQSFISENEFCDKLHEVNTHSTTSANYQRRFYQWFDGFRVLKFVHHVRDERFSNVDVSEAVDWLLAKFGQATTGLTKKDKLLLLRDLDRSEVLFQTGV